MWTAQKARNNTPLRLRYRSFGKPYGRPWTPHVDRRPWPDPHRRIRHRAQPRTTARNEAALLENAHTYGVALATGAQIACCGLILHRSNTSPRGLGSSYLMNLTMRFRHMSGRFSMSCSHRRMTEYPLRLSFLVTLLSRLMFLSIFSFQNLVLGFFPLRYV